MKNIHLENLIVSLVTLGIFSFIMPVRTEVIETDKYLITNVSHNFSGVVYENVRDEKIISRSIPYGDYNEHLKDLRNGDILLEHKEIGRNIYGLRMRVFPQSKFEINKK